MNNLYCWRIYLFTPDPISQNKEIGAFIRNTLHRKWDYDMYDNGVGQSFDYLHQKHFLSALRKIMAVKAKFKLRLELWGPDGKTKLNAKRVLADPKQALKKWGAL